MNILKKLVRLLAGLVVVVVCAVIAVYVISSARMNRTYDVTPVSVETSEDSATLAWGRHVADVRGCTDCHGPDLSGTTFIDALPVMARITASNLTSGEHGVAPSYASDEDWVRAIRDGVKPDGKPVLFMPSYEFRALGPRDLGALVSFIKSVPPVDTQHPSQKVGPLARALFLSGKFPLLPAEMVDHSDQSFSQPEVGVTVEYGAYLAVGCTGCHGPGLTGGLIPGMPPEAPPAFNLTPDEATGLGSWTEDDFHAFFATGVGPDGRAINPEFMPWPGIGAAMTRDELTAVWLYLRSVNAAPAGNR